MAPLRTGLLLMLALLLPVESSDHVKVGVPFSFYYDYNFLLSVIMAHLDLMKHFNSTIREKYGDPILPIENLHPNMSAVEVITRECAANAIYCTAATEELLLEHDVNAFVGDFVTAACETTGSLAASHQVPHLSLCLGTDIAKRSRYPYTFRAVAKTEVIYEFMWQYMKYFNFRTAILLYTNDGFYTAINNIKEYAQAEGRGDAVNSIAFYGDTWSEGTLENIASKIRALPIRLLLMGYGSRLATAMHTFLVDYGLTRPKYQIVTTTVNRNSFISSAFIGWHEIVGRLSSEDRTLDKWYELKANLTQSDIMDLLDTYGVAGWSPVPFIPSRLPSDADLISRDSMSESISIFVIATFSVLHTAFVGMNELLNEGYEADEIRGSLLKDKLQSLDIRGIGKSMFFDDNLDASITFGLMQFRNVTMKYNAFAGAEILQPVAELVCERNANGTIPDDVGAVMWPDGSESRLPPQEYNQCHPGSYVADDGTCVDCPLGAVSHDFDMTECSTCPVGTHSNEAATLCLNCSVGTIAAERGLSVCAACPAGQYSDEEMGSSCMLCPKGTYAPGVGSVTCTECAYPLSTADVGSTSENSCICPPGTYSDEYHNCIACGEGLLCTAGAALHNLPKSPEDVSKSDVEQAPYPEVEKGYYTTYEDPLSVYLCLKKEYCPGHLPEACATNSVGIGCGNCIEGYYRDQTGSCQACTSVMRTRGLLIAVPTVLIPVAYIFSLDTSDITTWYRARNMVPCLVYITLFFVQALCMYSIFAIELPTDTESFANSLSFSLDFRTLLHPECAEFYEYSANFAAGLVTPIYFAVIVFLAWAISALASRIRSLISIRWCCALSFFGGCYSTFFVSIANLTLNLFACFKHPNGKWSLRSAGHMLCYEDDWNALLAMGVAGIFFYCVVALAVMIFAIWRAPRYYPFLTYRLATKFLFVRFRTGYAWWSILLLLKGLLVSMTPVLFTDGISQFLWSNVIFTGYTPLVAALHPWWSNPITALDIFSHMVLCYIFGMGGFFADTTESQKLDVSRWMFFGAWLVAAGVLFCALHIVYVMYRQGYKEESYLSGKTALASQICAEMQRLVEKPEMLTYLLKVLPDAEVSTFRAIHHIISREVGKSMSVTIGEDASKPLSFSSRSLSSQRASEKTEEKQFSPGVEQAESPLSLPMNDASTRMSESALEVTRVEAPLSVFV